MCVGLTLTDLKLLDFGPQRRVLQLQLTNMSSHDKGMPGRCLVGLVRSAAEKCKKCQEALPCHRPVKCPVAHLLMLTVVQSHLIVWVK